MHVPLEDNLSLQCNAKWRYLIRELSNRGKERVTVDFRPALLLMYTRQAIDDVLSGKRDGPNRQELETTYPHTARMDF
jgi:hypothetical protein